MYIHDIQLVNFKNYEEAKFEFSPKVNCIVGNNGVGKTNLLDAVHYMSMTKSYFGSLDMPNINHGKDFFAIHAHCVFDDVEGLQKISCIQQEGKRKIFKINQKEYDKMSDHIGLLPSVMISPYDTDYINGIAEIRRKYFDSIISQIDKNYLSDLMTYNRLLSQRNAILKQQYDRNRFDKTELQIWDERLVHLGQLIFAKRQDFLQEFVPVFEDYFNRISPEKEVINVEYVSQLQNGDFSTLLSNSGERDFYSQHTSVGIHKDDYKFEMNAYPVKRYCSQGQQKTFLVALKLSQFAIIKQLTRKVPLLLLDDVFDKLDNDRIGELIKMVAGNSFGQVFISDTNKERMENLFQNHHIDFNLIVVED